MINRGIDDRPRERAMFLDTDFRHSIWEAAQEHRELECGCQYDVDRDELVFCSEEHQAKR
jgi:hypothetical protein